MAAAEEPLPGVLTNMCAHADAKPADKVTQGILREVISPNPITARHALALAVDLARKVIMNASQQGRSPKHYACDGHARQSTVIVHAADARSLFIVMAAL